MGMEEDFCEGWKVHEALLVRKRKQGDDKNKEKGHKNFLKLLNVVGMAQGSEKNKKILSRFTDQN